MDNGEAVRQAVASAALEGITISKYWQTVMLNVLEGREDADVVIEMMVTDIKAFISSPSHRILRMNSD